VKALTLCGDAPSCVTMKPNRLSDTRVHLRCTASRAEPVLDVADCTLTRNC
jgi:hypothetical protein